MNKIPLALTRGNIKFPRGNINLEFLRVVPGLRVWECLRYTVQGSGLRVQVELLGYATAKLGKPEGYRSGFASPSATLETHKVQHACKGHSAYCRHLEAGIQLS